MRRFSIAALAVLAAVSLQPRVRAAAADEGLKVTHETLVRAIQQGNLALVQGLVHEHALGFFYDSQMVAQIKPGFTPAEALPSVIADLSRFTSTTSSTTYRVVGDTGVVCMTAVRVPKNDEKKKDSSLKTAYYRLTYTYVRQGDAWKLLSWHTSDTPLEK